MESIDALALAVNEFEGGLVLVSHDMRLISQVAKEIWICDNKRITKYRGDIQSFKLDMRDQMGIEGKQKGQLRGDASVMKKNEDDETKKEKKKNSTTKKAPPAPTTKSQKPVSTQAPDPAPINSNTGGDVWGSDDEEDDKGCDVWGSDEENEETSFGTSSLQNALPSTPAPAPAGRYIPPHLRNRS